MTIWPDMPDCGVYLAWPDDGTQWIHPDDIELATQWIPSNRVLRRHSYDGEYYRLQYGEQKIRVKPTMWHRVVDEGFAVGDQVEVLGRFMENEPCIGRITEIRFDKHYNRILYSVETRELPLPRPFILSDLMPLHRKMQLRESDSNPPQARQVEIPGMEWLKLEDTTM